MQNLRSLTAYDDMMGLSYIGIFFCFIDFLLGIIYFIISKNNMKIFLHLLSVLTIDILKRLYEIYYYADESYIKSLIILCLSAAQFYIIISFLFRVLSNLDYSEKEKLFHKIISTCIYGSIIICENYNYYSIKLVLIILLICYLHFILRKGIKEYINIFLDKIGDNILLYGILYNIPYLIYCAAFASCGLTCLTFFINNGIYLGYISLGFIIFNELLKNCTFIFLSGILYLSNADLEIKNVGKPVEIKVGKL